MFYIIFDSGNFPSIWTEGIIISLFKEGHANDANNYRGITLIICRENNFTSVINNRLLKWSDENIVTDAQFGFKPGYGTTDAIFSLHTIISKVLLEREMFYLTTHSTHFIYGYMASDIWLRTILIVRKETRCRHIGYSYRLTARVLLYAPSHRQDNTYHGLCYTSRGALAGTRKVLLSNKKLYCCFVD